MTIERFSDNQAEEVSALIQRNLLQINSKDYPPEYISYLLDCFSPANILANAQTQHIFVAVEEGKVVGTGGLANFGSHDRPSYYGVAVFVAPECHGKGIGRQLMQAVETKARKLGAEKITI